MVKPKFLIEHIANMELWLLDNELKHKIVQNYTNFRKTKYVLKDYCTIALLQYV